jgi:hypothetical protein
MILKPYDNLNLSEIAISFEHKLQIVLPPNSAAPENHLPRRE